MPTRPPRVASGFVGDRSHNSLMVMGAAGDSVDLLVTPGAGEVGDGGAWASAGSVTIGAETYTIYNFANGGDLVASIGVDADMTTILCDPCRPAHRRTRRDVRADDFARLLVVARPL